MSLWSALVLAVPAAEIVKLQCGSALRIPNNKIEITVEDSGKMTVKTQDMRSEWVEREKTIDAGAISELKTKLSSVDWPVVAKEKTKGLDGTSVNLYHSRQKFSLWSPEFDSRKRGLIEVQQAIEYLYQLADLTKEGMSAKKP